MNGPTHERDALGCEAFGHLVSPYVDGELVGSEHEQFDTHFPACGSCQRLADEYVAVEAAWRRPIPAVSETDWNRAWRGVESAVRETRAQAARSPFARVAAWLESTSLGRWSAALRPLAYVAAAAALVVVLFAVRGGLEPDGRSAPGPRVAQAASAPDVEAVTCKGPDWVPVVWTSGGEEPLTVVQCVLLGTET